MAKQTRQKTNGKKWMEDNDDAHFQDNPAVGKKTKKKVEALPKGHPAVKVTKKGTTRKKYPIKK